MPLRPKGRAKHEVTEDRSEEEIKTKKNKPLTKWENRFNKLIGKTRLKLNVLWVE